MDNGQQNLHSRVIGNVLCWEHGGKVCERLIDRDLIRLSYGIDVVELEAKCTNRFKKWECGKGDLPGNDDRATTFGNAAAQVLPQVCAVG